MDKVKKCVKAIVTNDQKFKKKHKDHPLDKGVREMHIDRQYNDDWLLYYRFNEYTEQIELILLDIGNHNKHIESSTKKTRVNCSRLFVM